MIRLAHFSDKGESRDGGTHGLASWPVEGVRESQSVEMTACAALLWWADRQVNRAKSRTLGGGVRRGGPL
jgi:hypothetical protein